MEGKDCEEQKPVPSGINTSQGEIMPRDPNDRPLTSEFAILWGPGGLYDPLDPERVLDQPWKVKIEKMYREIDASEGTMGKYSDSPCNIPNQTVYSGVDDGSEVYDFEKDDLLKMMLGIALADNLSYAKTALEFYEKCQGAEFEIVKVLYSTHSSLGLRGADTQVWCHVSFTAKANNADCSDDVYLFAELLQDDNTKKFNAVYCSLFEPSNDSGFDHGCMMCRPNLKFHPADGYKVGRYPYHVLGRWS